MRHRVVNAKKMNWDAAADAKLLHLFSQGLHKNDVAREMGTSISSSEARYRKLKKKEQNNGNQEAYKN